MSGSGSPNASRYTAINCVSPFPGDRPAAVNLVRPIEGTAQATSSRVYLRNRLSCRYSLLNRLLDSFSYSLSKNVTLSRNLFKASLNKDAAPLAGGNSCAFPTTLPARLFLSGSCLVLEVLCGTAGVL